MLYAFLDGSSSADSIISGFVCEAIQRLAGLCQARAGLVADEIDHAAAA